MSKELPKNDKGKSPQPSSDGKNTFIENVKLRVSGIFTNTIEKWFSSPNTSKANGSTLAADGTDSSSEDELPPLKRRKFSNSTGNSNNYDPPEANSFSNIMVNNMSPTAMADVSVHSSQLPRERRRISFKSVPTSSDDIETEESKIDGSAFLMQPTTSGWGRGGLKRKSLFLSSSALQPSKNVEVKTSEKESSQSSLKPSSGSPFYPGYTTYGGASASYMNHANIAQTTFTHVNESKSNETSTMSSSTRRVMELLEQFSSPVTEARRIQSCILSSNLNLSSTRASSKVPYSFKGASYKTRELLLPSFASIMQMKKKSRLMDTTTAARQIIASNSSSGQANRKVTDSNKQTTKITIPLARTYRGENLMEIVDPVILPEVHLVIDQNNLPKFSFNQTVGTSTPKPVVSIEKNQETIPQEIPKETGNLDCNSLKFKFSDPVRILTDAPVSNFSPHQFTFNNPDTTVEDRKIEEDNMASSAVISITKENEQPIDKGNKWQCADCWVANKSDAPKCMCCGGKPPKPTAAKDSLSVSNSVTKEGVKTMDKAKSWQCADCWVSNTAEAKKCVCCGGKPPSQTTSKDSVSVSNTVTKENDQADDKTKDWQCAGCWVSNKSDAKKCVCCGDRPSKQSTAKDSLSSSKSSTKEKPIKKGKGWQCADCWVNNKPDAKKCVSCGAKPPKPTTAKDSVSASHSTTKKKTKSMKSAKDWQCADCWASNKSDAKKCVCCGVQPPMPSTTKGSLSASQSIMKESMKPIKTVKDWQCAECWVTNIADAKKCECCGGKPPTQITAKDTLAASQSVTKDVLKPIKTVKDWQCSECWVNNSTEAKKCICCGGKPATQITAHESLSVSSRIKVSGSLQTETLTAPNLFKLPIADPNKWKCEECWISNSSSAESCECCGANKPKSQATSTKPETSEALSGASTSTGPIKPLPSVSVKVWVCEECWVSNTSNMDKCATCGNPQLEEIMCVPSPTMAITPEYDSPLLNDPNTDENIQLKSQAAKWTCYTCLVDNDIDTVKCVCCESNKPDATKDNKQFNFGKKSIGLQFGVEWDKPEMMSSDSPAMPSHTVVTPTPPSSSLESNQKFDQTETNNNVPTFTFTLPTKKPLDQVDNSDKKDEDSTKMTFKFGIPKELPTVASSKEPIKITPVTEGGKKTLEEPKIDLFMPAQVKSKPFDGGLFSAPQIAPEATKVDNVAPIPISTASTAQNVNESGPSNVPPLPATSTIGTTANTFSFSGGGLRMASNLFSPPTTTVPAATISFGLPIQTTSNSTSVVATDSMSLFQNQEATTVASPVFAPMNSAPNVSSTLFQKNDTTTTAAPPSLGGTQPIFSFGSNTPVQTSVHAPAPHQSTTPNKPKFNFTFGSGNKSDAPTMFKPSMFGAPTENAPQSNKFTFASAGNGMGASNSLGGGNALLVGNTMASGALGVGNGMATSTVPTGNEMSDLASGHSMQTGGNSNLFGANIQKENIWSSNIKPATNVFVSSTPANKAPKSPAFTFGALPFNANSTTNAFGANPQPTPNLFGMASQNNNAPSMFSSPAPNAPAPSMFGRSQNTAPQPMGMFDAPTFGSSNTSVPSFEAPAPAPAFNFGTTQPTNVFGFGQQQPQQQVTQQQQVPQSGIYSFGGAGGPPGAGPAAGAPGAPHVLFNMGSAPSTATRRVKKAVRRNPPR